MPRPYKDCPHKVRGLPGAVVKRLLGWMFIALIGLLAAACASAPSPTPTLSAEATPEASPHVTSNSGQPTEDISLITKTGRPQFLDSFAHW